MKKIKKLLTIGLAIMCICGSLTACSKKDNSSEQINELKDQIEEMQGEISSLQDEITSLNAALTELNAAKLQLETKLSTLESDNTSNKSEISTLKTKVAALETASLSYQQRLSALDASSSTFTSDINTLKTDLSDLINKVSNATHIERVVITPDDIGPNSVITSAEAYLNYNEEKTALKWIKCDFDINGIFPYPLVSCNVTLNINNKTFTYLASSVLFLDMERAWLNYWLPEPIPCTPGVDIVSAHFDNIVAYRFY